MRIFVAMLIVCTAVIGCTSPETRRMRGQGRGADIGNRSSTVKMHEGSQPFYKTPERIPAEHPVLEPARQADTLSR